MRLLHMLEAAEKALQFSDGMTLVDLEDDDMRQFALARAIEIVGEAANYVTDEFKSAHPGIAWADIIDLRHRLIHAYFKTDTDVVWTAVTEELPKLVTELRRIIPTDDTP